MFTREEQIEHEKAWKLNDERNKEIKMQKQALELAKRIYEEKPSKNTFWTV